MTPTLVQPRTPEEAIALLAATAAPFDSPTNHRVRDRAYLERVFANGARRPELVWALQDDHGRVVASVAALSYGPGLVLDHWSATDPALLTELLATATEAGLARGDLEVGLFVPADLTRSDPTLAAWEQAFDRAGWQVLVERCHYEFDAAPDLAAGVSTELRLEQLTGPDDERFVAVRRSVLKGSLDVDDRELVERLGLDAAARESVEELLEADPWVCVRLAFAPGDDRPVGYVSWVDTPGGRGYLNVLGVCSSARGHGYGAQLVALATRGLLEAGSTTLIADTDRSNVPMVRAFELIGWEQTETRIDLTRG